MESNPYFSAGFGLMGVGAALAGLRRGITFGAGAAQRRLLISLEIPSKDPSYLWFLEWLSAKGKREATTLKPGQPQIKLYSHQLSVETAEKKQQDSNNVTFSLVPGPGTHWFRYKGAWMQVKRERDGKMMDLTQGTPWETVTLTTLRRDSGLFADLLHESRKLAEMGTQGKTVVYTSWMVDWKPFGKPRRRRELSSVVLDRDVKQRVADDLDKFQNRGQWYAERGIPYRRGYLLHGPPGSGKSSFIYALAGHFKYNICLLNLSEKGLTDDRLNHLLVNAPERSIILLEDIDAAFNKRVQTGADGYQSAVTFSGLLNALDGVASGEERVIFMTTNHFTKLDKALVRPGRVDMIELLGDASTDQAGELFGRFYPDASTEELHAFIDKLQEGMDAGYSVSMASLQGMFIRTTAVEAIKYLPMLFEIQFINSDLSDSTTGGLPRDIQQQELLFPSPSKGILLQVISITDIGISAYNLKLNRDQKSALKLKLSDGRISVDAFEYAEIPWLSLSTPIGSKLLLKNVELLQGTLLLTPFNTQQKNGKIDDFDKYRDKIINDILDARLGRVSERTTNVASASTTANTAADVIEISD
ncbi:hypothetical protein E3P88_01696 [Wallemia ichthyophaga]|uniref:Mitochondrial chaperone BCS1 n=1 Tax=Wallemia ichthyophaga TaxID=245174 RepID=A0A4T0IC84_WALIC|nr:hypothetical protein E3P96_01799 [Wallemia ichthyophaga]TIB13196.1 hypothetical protein E3P90_01741 [Wallemia ichthyophaga]TIB14948.1 hypothetical protein E3P93_01491 [Wallemia ichthyophaga]TIB25292.1 hypothetical protein E3P88_01696 [Wallemia ichthyophaga]